MTTKKILETRRQRNKELAQMDMRNRCAICKRSLLDGGTKTVVLVGPLHVKLCAACAEDQQ